MIEIVISREIYNQMVEAAKKSYPNEAHGYLFNNNSVFEKGIASEKSGGHFIGSLEQTLDLALKYNNKPPSSLFHSHPCSAIPSMTDLREMDVVYRFWGEIPSLILSDTYRLRAWIYRKEIEVKIV